MDLRKRIAIGAVAILGAVILFKLLMGDGVVALLSPAGPVAGAQRHLIVAELSIMLTAVVIVIALFFIVAWKFRAMPGDAPAKPKSRNSKSPHRVWGELLLWAIPSVIIAGLSLLVWPAAHALDPARAIDVTEGQTVKPLTIQVVALPWKWLFIYPEQHIATLNFLEFPEKTPIHFELTADGPMSSFWIPQLGSQIYAMSSMQTNLNLMASTTGEFPGKDTEINGAGYAGMTFTAKSILPSDFDAWVGQVRAASVFLDATSYASLAMPSEYVQPEYFSGYDSNLYDTIMGKYLAPDIGIQPGGAETL